jgi:hypothetical protein
VQDVFQNAFEALSSISVPIFCLTIVALADELFLLAKRSVMAARLRSRRR